MTALLPDHDSALTTLPATTGESGGIGLLLQQELDLRRSVEGILVGLNWPHSAEIDRTLREQRVRLSANIAVLNQRYMLPPTTAATKSPVPPAPEGVAAGDGDEIPSLEELIAQYRAVLATIASLIAKGTDRERGRMILAQVAHSHDEMTAHLSALLEEPTMFQHPLLTPPSSKAPTPSEARWDNEGGPPPAQSPSPGLPA